MRPLLAIAGVELRRFLRDRSNIFFVFVFPLLLVLLIGAQFGGSSGGNVVVSGPDSQLRTALVTELREDDVDVGFAGHDDALEQIARGRTDLGLFVDEAAVTAYEQGADLTVEVVPAAQATAQATTQRVLAAIESVGTEQGQLRALTDRGLDATAAEQALAAAQESVTGPTLRVENLNEVAQEFAGLGQFDLGASGQLLLFVFLSSLAGSATLIQARRYGVVARALSMPVTTGQLLGGQALGRFTIAAFQGGYIMAATALLFDVRWGSLGVAVLILVLFSLVSAGAAMLIGAVMDNEGAASGVGVGAGLVLAALGGSMFPLELFPDTLRTIAHVTPHAWAYEAFAEVQRHDGTLLDVLPQLGVLAAMAALLLAVGTWALRRSMSRAM